MRFVADFHIHSHYSLATSKELTPEYLDFWGKLKGVQVIGTGDFTHPMWLNELKTKLNPIGNGLYGLKSEYIVKNHLLPAKLDNDNVGFILSAEISSIYKKDGKVRKVHNIILAPDFDKASKIQQQLLNRGFNISSDGRPIIGLDSKLLLELCLEVSDEICFIPAHIWTPWFSVLGDKSGFDSLEACFEELTQHIYAVEMGLSSNPPLNWMCSILDKFTLIANSDAHSPEKVGRNANIFNTDLSYAAIVNALKNQSDKSFEGTINLFPQEGKYHFDGHRKCNVCFNPLETLKHSGLCPVCGKKLTIGVTNRIAQLSDRVDLSTRPFAKPYHSIVPLKEIIAETENASVSTKKVESIYHQMLLKCGSEFEILLETPVEQLRKSGFPIVSEAIARMRAGNVIISEGYDGEYGSIKLFSDGELQNVKAQKNFFDKVIAQGSANSNICEKVSFNLDEYKELRNLRFSEEPLKHAVFEVSNRLNQQQEAAMKHLSGPALILAGPGTGKTKVLTMRIAHLIKEHKVDPSNILALTFTNKAAAEMKHRLFSGTLNETDNSELTVATFHAFGLQIINDNLSLLMRERNYRVISNQEKEDFLYNRFGVSRNQLSKAVQTISNTKNQLLTEHELEEVEQRELFRSYCGFMSKNNLLDYDDLLYMPCILFKRHSNLLEQYSEKFKYILIDEYQDINAIQYELVKLITKNNRKANLFIIGDPNQAIYGFRGADIAYIQKFRRSYPDATVYELSKTYRCTTNIIEASASVLRSSTKPPLFETLRKGVRVKLLSCKSEKHEAEMIARTIESLVGGVRFFSIDSRISDGFCSDEISSFNDFAVLCRTKNQLKEVELALYAHSIPYHSVLDKPFFLKEPFNQITDVVRFAKGFDDVSIPEKILTHPSFESLIELVKTGTLINSIEMITDTFFLKAKYSNSGDFDAFYKLVKGLQTWDAFNHYISLATGVDGLHDSSEYVRLMTIHASKGLEFKCVFIAGCEDGLIPFQSDHYTGDLAEEARLFYVGMTRASTYLYLSHCENRTVNGIERPTSPSPFIKKISSQLLEPIAVEFSAPKKQDNQLSLF